MISNGLLVPVVILLILLFLRAIVLIGTFFGQYMAIRRTASIIDTCLGDNPKLGELYSSLPERSSSLVINYMRRLIDARADSALVQRLLADFEIAADKDLGVSKTLVKLGPMLGLMGTLIPMGPALVGLATGDIGSMAYNMQVSFATTVIGLFSAAIGFITQQVKQRWYLQDMTNLEYISNIIANEKESVAS